MFTKIIKEKDVQKKTKQNWNHLGTGLTTDTNLIDTGYYL